MSCIVENCKSLRRLLPIHSNITFHRIPKDETVFRKWLDCLNVPDKTIQWKKTLFVCSKHFDASDFEFGGPPRLLKKNALPKLVKQETDNLVSTLDISRLKESSTIFIKTEPDIDSNNSNINVIDEKIRIKNEHCYSVSSKIFKAKLIPVKKKYTQVILKRCICKKPIKKLNQPEEYILGL